MDKGRKTDRTPKTSKDQPNSARKIANKIDNGVAKSLSDLMNECESFFQDFG